MLPHTYPCPPSTSTSKHQAAAPPPHPWPLVPQPACTTEASPCTPMPSTELTAGVGQAGAQQQIGTAPSEEQCSLTSAEQFQAEGDQLQGNKQFLKASIKYRLAITELACESWWHDVAAVQERIAGVQGRLLSTPEQVVTISLRHPHAGASLLPPQPRLALRHTSCAPAARPGWPAATCTCSDGRWAGQQAVPVLIT